MSNRNKISKRPSGDLMLNFTWLEYSGTGSHCTPVLVSQCTPNDNHFNFVQHLEKMGSPGYIHFTPIVCKVVTNVINIYMTSVPEQLSTVELQKKGIKLQIR